jgi:hypothetical protein
MDLRLLAHKAHYGNRGLTLENMDDDLPEGGDAAIGSFAEECDQAFTDTEHQSDALESIRDYTNQLANLISRKEVSLVTLALIRQGVDHQAARLGREVILPALESIDDVPLEAQAVIALEGFKNFLGNVVQEFVVGFKHQKDVIGDFLRTTSQITAKYEKKTLENKREWNTVKGNLGRGDVSVGANGLLYFFAKGKNNPTVGKLFGKGVLLSAMKEDLAISNYILSQYPKAILIEMKALAAILRSASFKTPESMLKIAQRVEKLKTPTELFDKKYHGAELLGASVLVAPAAKPKAIKTAEHAAKLPRLAEMAGSKQVGYSYDKAMAVLQGAHTVGSIAGSVALSAVAPGLGVLNSAAHHATHTLSVAALTSTPETSYTFNVKDIETIFDIAEKYLDNVRICIGYEREIVRVMDELDAAVEKIEASGDELADELLAKEGNNTVGKEWDDYAAQCHIFELILNYGSSLRRAVQKPVYGEVARALRGSKYCNYLGLRAIHNAQSNEVATESTDISTNEEPEKTITSPSAETETSDNTSRNGMATESEAQQENIRQMDEAASNLHEKYHKLMTDVADNPKKFADLGRELAVKQGALYQKFMQSHPKD